MKASILIFGSGHLARRVKHLAEIAQNEIKTIPTANAEITENNGLPFEELVTHLSQVDLKSLSRVFLLDNRDEHNIQVLLALLSLNTEVPITISLFNEHIAPHLIQKHPHISVVNPAKMAAPFFVKALLEPLNQNTLNFISTPNKTSALENGRDTLLIWLIASFFSLATAITIFFKFAESLSWLDAIYFVVVTVATVGYGDINLLNSGALSKVMAIVLIFCSTIFIWMIFSLTIDRIIKKRVQLSLGRKKYFYQDHVIVCGLGRLGECVAEELKRQGQKVIVIEQNEQLQSIEQLRRKGVPVYVGNARLLSTLEEVNISKAKALISLISDDYLNLEIGLNARSLQPRLRIVLRIFDDLVAKNLKNVLDIQHPISMSAVIDDIIFNLK